MHMTTKALVLRQVDYKESDKILTLFTQEQGELTASARGCRKKGERPGRAMPAIGLVRNGVIRLPGALDREGGVHGTAVPGGEG